MHCPLCHSKETQKFHTDAHRDYFKCAKCDLIFVSSEFYLSADDEKKRYEYHENKSDNKGYIEFLKQFINPMMERVEKGSEGLDFGSGPDPVLASIFKKAGYSMELYDAFFQKDESVFQRSYDFITVTEVVEHLHQPLKEIERLWSCLKHKGTLGIMTKFSDNHDFSRWRYKDDRTHVCFFSTKTFHWLANHLGATLEIPKQDVVFLTKQKVTSGKQ